MISYGDIKSGRTLAPATDDGGLALEVIQIDGGTQSRATLNQHVVDDYAEAIKAGATFPPITVFYDGKKHWLADGFHRFHAYQKAGKTKVAADVRQGTRRDAILHSVGANETHGLRRTRDDKRRAVLTLLNDSEWSAKPERWIATTANVSHTYVQKIRAEHLATLPDRPSQVEVERGGKTYTMQTASIGAKPVSKENLATEATTPEPSLSKASEPKTAPEGTAPEGEDLDAIRAGHITRYHVLQLRSAWSKANAEARAIFLAEFNLRQESNPATGTGDDDVDRSAERASSAVEVGAPVSPEGAHEAGRFDSGSLTEIVVKSQVRVLSGTPMQGAKGGPTGMGRSDGGERPATHSPSTVRAVEAVTADPQTSRPVVTAEVYPDPLTPLGDDGRPGTPSTEASGAKIDGLEVIVGQAGHEPGHFIGHSVQEPAGNPQDDSPVVSGGPASVSHFINPRCQKPEACKWAHSQVSCWRCNSAAREVSA